MTTPNIMKETCEGTACIPIQDALFRRREIYCTGEIDAETANSIIVQLHFLALEDSGEITMYINSTGGEVDSGLAIYDTMQTIPAPVRTVCMGTAASMAAVLFASGAKREIMPHARVLIHDPLIAGSGVQGSARKIDSIAKDLMHMREAMGKILARHTGHDLDEVLEKTADNCSFDAEQAVAWGLADNVINQF